MISLKKYLDSVPPVRDQELAGEQNWATAMIEVYGASLLEMGNCGIEACPVTGDDLKRNLTELRASLSPEIAMAELEKTEAKVRQELASFGHATAKYYQQKARDAKEMLLAMARTAESVSVRDERCAGQMNAVTDRLKTIASLDDLSQIRSSIETSAAELKASIGRMVAEGKAALTRLREQVTDYQSKLEEAEAAAWRDALTGLSSRLYVEAQIEKRVGAEAEFCVGLIDIDGFKRVNDEHGHLTGDALLSQFALELRSACRATDMIGRWGGDEFILLFDCGLTDAVAQAERLRKWICGDYSIRGRQGEVKLHMDASIGVAAHELGEPMQRLMERADARMYAEKAIHKQARDRHPKTTNLSASPGQRTASLEFHRRQ